MGRLCHKAEKWQLWSTSDPCMREDDISHALLSFNFANMDGSEVRTRIDHLLYKNYLKIAVNGKRKRRAAKGSRLV